MVKFLDVAFCFMTCVLGAVYGMEISEVGCKLNGLLSIAFVGAIFSGIHIPLNKFYFIRNYEICTKKKKKYF